MIFVRKKGYSQLPIHIKKEDRFIFFTLQGFFYWVVLFLFFSLSLNYNSNIGIVCCYILFSLYIYTLFENIFSLNKIILKDISYVSHEYQKENDVTFHFLNTSKRKTLAKVYIKINNDVFPLVWDDNASAIVKWNFSKSSYGIYRLPTIKLFTFGMLSITKAWSSIKLKNPIKILPDYSSKRKSSLYPNNHFLYKKSIRVSNKQKYLFQSPKNLNNSSSTVSSANENIMGIRYVMDNEHPHKIAWKQTYKTGRVMTYIYHKEDPLSYFSFSWSNQELSLDEKINDLISKMQYALNQKAYFQVTHPNFTTKIGNDKFFIEYVLLKILDYSCEIKKW